MAEAGPVVELAVYRHLVAAQVRTQLQYPASFFGQLAGNLGIQAGELAAILILFRHFETLGGWRVGEIAFLFALSTLSLGLADFFTSGFSAFSGMIVRGEFDRLLVRPAGAMLQVLASDVQLRRLGRIIQGFVAFGLADRWLNLDWTPGRLLYLPVVVLCAALLFAALFALEATLCFWTTESGEFVNAFTYGGCQLALYPLHIYDLWLRRLFLFVIPIGFVVYAPSLYLLDKPDPLGLPLWTRFVSPVAALLFALAAGAAWGAGVRHYRSTGT